MPLFEATYATAVPPERMWAALMEWEATSDWMFPPTEVEVIGEQRTGVGTRLRAVSTVAGGAPAEVIREDEHTVAFLDIAPIARGHTLVIPRTHHVDLTDIGPARAAHVMRAAVEVAAMLQRALEPGGMNLIHATGALAGQTVSHFHVHVLPRYGDDLRVSFPERHAASADELADIGALIRP